MPSWPACSVPKRFALPLIALFNKGDGSDTVVNSVWKADTISLGGGIKYADLARRRTYQHQARA